jgi:NAD(P)-dependent dehydrogenase (short-subunit alcohol dehydrogenase family)
VRLKDRVAIITGGGTGIGKATALRFAREGARLALAGRREAPLAATAAEVAAAGGQAIVTPADVGVEDQVVRLVAAVLERYGQLDILVNNAGFAGEVLPVAEMTLAEWDRVLAVNLTGQMLCAREAVKAMRPRGRGAIVNLSSHAGKEGQAGRAHYSAAKWGVIGFTQALAREVGPHGIRVNCVAPGPVLTEGLADGFAKRAHERGVTVADVTRMYTERSALRRISLPEEAAALICFLCTDEAAAMTGQALNLTSGMWMT